MTHPTLPTSPADQAGETPFGLNEADLADYLMQTPEFFTRHADVLHAVQFSNPHGGRAISLQERQAEVMRDRIRSLEAQLLELKRNAHNNQTIQDNFHAWTLSLLAAPQPSDLPSIMERDLSLRFGVPEVVVRVWDVSPQWADMPFAQGGNTDVRALANSLLEPYCGVDRDLSVKAWLDYPQEVRSLALIALRESPGAKAFGLMVLGSPDEQRFRPDMGTAFLERMAELASAALGRLRMPA